MTGPAIRQRKFAVISVTAISLAAVTVLLSLLLLSSGRTVPQEVETPSEESLFFRPTPPVRTTRVITEQEPMEALVVAMPDEQVLGNSPKEEFVIRLIEISVQYVKVVVFINKNDDQVRIKALFAKYARHPLQLQERVEFVSAQCDTEWIRDYAPIFGIGLNGECVLLDNMYRDIRSEACTSRSLSCSEMLLTQHNVRNTNSSVERNTLHNESKNAIYNKRSYLSDYGTFWRRNDDAAPLYFNQWIYTRYFGYVRMVRTPIQLWGGDVAFDNEGRLFTSTETLILNGGNDCEFRKWIDDYYSVKHVVYLRPLPNSIWHIDLFFKLGESHTLLLGEFDEHARYESERLAEVHKEAMTRMRWNRALIALTYPKAKIIPVPMPPILFSSVAEPDDGVNARDELGNNASEKPNVKGKRYLTVCYRSFLNSVVLRGEKATGVLIPTHSGIELMEQRVASAYRQAFPNATLHFINCDAVNEEFGGIHCVTATIPTHLKVQRH